MLVELTQNLQPAIVIGFPQRKRGLLARNAFHHLNKDICTVEGDIITVDYEHLLCANGQLVVPDVTVSYQTANSKLAFVQTAMEEEVNCNADDLVYGVLLEKEKGFCRLVQLRVRGEGGSTSAALPQGWKKENLIVYTFALSANKKKASKSQFLELEEEASRMLKREFRKRDSHSRSRMHSVNRTRIRLWLTTNACFARMEH